MASIFTHPVIPLALRLALGRDAISNRLLVAASIASMLPDADSVGYWLGIPYASLLGHRGLAHSLTVTFVIAIAAAIVAPLLRASRAVAFAVVFLSAASHGLLDAVTTGGHGVAFFSPFSTDRHFLPWRFLQVSPIGVRSFLSGWGGRVLISEWKYVWVPLLLLSLAVHRIRSRSQREGYCNPAEESPHGGR